MKDKGIAALLCLQHPRGYFDLSRLRIFLKECAMRISWRRLSVHSVALLFGVLILNFDAGA